MARQIVFTSKAAKPSPAYSQAVKAAGLVFVSGTAPTDPETGQIKGTTIQEQTRQCLTNITAILEEAGTSMEKIASATVILAEEDDFGFPPIHPHAKAPSFRHAFRASKSPLPSSQRSNTNIEPTLTASVLLSRCCPTADSRSEVKGGTQSSPGNAIGAACEGASPIRAHSV